MLFSKICHKFSHFQIQRQLLTKSYFCAELWNERMNGVDCKMSANDLNIKLQGCLNNNVPISALDFDILMNKTDEIDVMNLHFIIKTVKDFRKTQESVKAFDSSAHALVRNLVHMDEHYQALELIRDREKTGVFLDAISFSLLVDKFIDEGDWERAFWTSAEWLLQEEGASSASGEVAASMALLSCLRYWHHMPSSWQHDEGQAANEEGSDDQQAERFVFVPYLRAADTFDDHFDLTTSASHRQRLLGRCMQLAVSNGLGEGTLGWNVRLLALALEGRAGDVLARLREGLERGMVVTGSMVEAIKGLVGPGDLQDQIQDLEDRLRQGGLLDDDPASLETALDRLANGAKASSGEDRHRQEVAARYSTDRDRRRDSFLRETRKAEARAVLEAAKTRLLAITEREEMLRYFERLPAVMYGAWLARRTAGERAFSPAADLQEDLDNLRSKARKGFVVQHVLD